MITINKADLKDSKVLVELARQTFVESHGRSALKSEIDSYVNEKYSFDVFNSELADKNNIYHLIYFNEIPVGFSKIVLNAASEKIRTQNITKLDRIYILEKYYNQKLGLKLFEFIVKFSKENNQAGMWLFVWTENERAIRFYQKNKFEIVGSYDFKISATHSNPNHQMYLKYDF